MQGYDAKACRRLQSAHSHACDGPNLAALRSHPDQCDANQASFPYPTPVSAPKSASFPYPTRLHTLKRGVFGKAVYQSLLIYGVYWIRTIKSDQIYGV